MKFRLKYYVIPLIAASICSKVSADDKVRNSRDDDDVFVPTHEWQVVRQDQKIPKGLHVRINLQTGLKEAKLLDEHGSKNAVLEIPPEENLNEIDAGNSNQQLHNSKLVEALQKIQNDYVEDIKRIKNDFKSYDEIKKDLSDLNLIPKTDAEILKELIEKHEKSVDGEEILLILEDLEYLVHQFDNANEFVQLSGFEKIILKNFNSSNLEIKRETLKLLGSSMQNNGKVQIHALESGCVDRILKILALESDYLVKNRAVFALSSLVRRFPLAQLKLVENAGLTVFEKLLRSGNLKLQIKIITLIHDLLIEHEDAREDKEQMKQYEKVALKNRLKEHNYCENLKQLLLSNLLADKNDHDSIEKCLTAINLVIDMCKSEFNTANFLDILKSLRSNYKILLKIEESTGETNFFASLHDLCSQILINLNYKTEL